MQDNNIETTYQRIARVFRDYFKSLDNDYNVLRETKIDCLQRSLLSLNKFLRAMYTLDSVGTVLHSPKLHLPGAALPIQIYDSKLDSNDYNHWAQVIQKEIESYKTQSSIENSMVSIGFPEEVKGESQYSSPSKESHVKHESPVNARAIAVAALLCSYVPEEKIKAALKKYGINSWKHYRDIHNGDVKDNYFTSKKIFTKLYHFKTCLNAFNSAFNVLKNDFNLNYPELINAQTKWVSHVMQMIENKSNEGYLVECMDLHDEIKEKVNETLQNP
ncbi:MAG TPA: hypothetical protein PKY29_06075 [Ferruginibacter sp.]|nr:hypothetical protein [Ferruginibacter sp.]HRO17698.1 hypothetical protein [Ferruginibacter sp.]HRQ20863.1 hypothetical protein [Ferruginibacter sp.]